MSQSLNIIFAGPNRVELREEPVPTLEPDEILCEARKSLISVGTETTCLRGQFDEGSNWKDWVQYPFPPGYSMAGVVKEVGAGVRDLKPGDRIAAWAKHKQRFTLKADAAYKIPQNVSDEAAAWLCLATTAQVGVRRATHVLGETIGLVGLGQLGQLVVQYLALSGARAIICIDPVRKRLDMATKNGATHALSLDVTKARGAVAEITDGRMLDVVYDITGHPAVLAPAIQLVKKFGRVILLGDTPNPTAQHLSPGVVSNSLSILGIHGTMTPATADPRNPWTRREIIELFFHYLAKGRMNVDSLTTHHFAPREAPDVYAALMRDRSEFMGVLFDWSR